MGSDRWIMVILMLVVSSWGLNIVMVKYMTQHLDPAIVTAIRIPIAGLALLVFAWGMYGFYKPDRKQWLLLLYIGVTSILIHQITLSFGVTMTSATNASLILGLNPLTTAILASLFVGERMTGRLIVGIALGFAGVTIAVTDLSPGGTSWMRLPGWGDTVMFVSMVGYVMGALLIKKLSATSIPTLVTTAYSTLIGGVLLNVIAIGHVGFGGYNVAGTPGMVWMVMLISALGATSLGSLGWNYAIKIIGAARTAMFINIMPFVSMVGAAVFLGEEIRLVHWLAFSVTSAGVMIAMRKPPAAGSPMISGRPSSSQSSK